jgi:HJR/Mrr/RecB family endonuclease
MQKLYKKRPGWLGWDAIKEITAGAALYQARYARTSFRRVAVANQMFTNNAALQAEANHVTLITREQLADLLGAHSINNYEMDEALMERLPMMHMAN